MNNLSPTWEAHLHSCKQCQLYKPNVGIDPQLAMCAEGLAIYRESLYYRPKYNDAFITSSGPLVLSGKLIYDYKAGSLVFVTANEEVFLRISDLPKIDVKPVMVDFRDNKGIVICQTK